MPALWQLKCDVHVLNSQARSLHNFYTVVVTVSWVAWNMSISKLGFRTDQIGGHRGDGLETALDDRPIGLSSRDRQTTVGL